MSFFFFFFLSSPDPALAGRYAVTDRQSGDGKEVNKKKGKVKRSYFFLLFIPTKLL
jgi:hypothetical protein